MNRKIMDRKGIITKNKRQFLQEERDWFPSMTNDEYKDQMYDDADCCKNCGIWYWNDCVKRCKCE
jgi:hypothetical protein